MATSTIGTDALASAAVTSAKLASGAPSRSQLPAGTVLQVVNATYGTQTNTTSSTYSDTGITASITPTSATSKILVVANVQGYVANTGTSYCLGLQVVRNSTAIAGILNAAFYGNGYNRSTLSTSYLDSPATTSATTYKIQMKATVAGYVVGVCPDGNSDLSTITLMEIAQ